MAFIPLSKSAPKGESLQADGSATTKQGFIPIGGNDKAHWYDPALETVKDIGRVYPVAETVASLGSQAVAIPVAGIAGLGAIATNSAGITATDPAEVVGQVGGALTYQPKTESGAHLNKAAMYPFEKLAELGKSAGDKVLDETGSPALATAVDTAINVAPMALGGTKSGAKTVAKPEVTEPPRPNATPLTQKEAGLSAKQKTQATGQEHVVVPHPSAEGRFTAVPLRQAETSIPEAVQSADTIAEQPENIHAITEPKESVGGTSSASATPFTQNLAEKSARQKTLANGKEYEVVPHPTMPSKFAVVEKRAAEPLLAEQVAQIPPEAKPSAPQESTSQQFTPAQPAALEGALPVGDVQLTPKERAVAEIDQIIQAGKDRAAAILKPQADAASSTVTTAPEKPTAISPIDASTNSVAPIAEPMEAAISPLGAMPDAPKAPTAPVETDIPRIVLGKNVREFSDASIQRLAGSQLVSPKARALLRDEIARRTDAVRPEPSVETSRIGVPEIARNVESTPPARVADGLDKAYHQNEGIKNELDYTTDKPRRFDNTGREVPQSLRTISGEPEPEGWFEATRIRSGRGSESKPLVVYRATHPDHKLATEHFDFDNLGYASDKMAAKMGVFSSTLESDAARHGSLVEKFYADIRNPAYIHFDDLPALDTPDAYRKFSQELQASGHDGIVLHGKNKDPHQIDHKLPYVHVVTFRPGQMMRAHEEGAATPMGGGVQKTPTSPLPRLDTPENSAGVTAPVTEHVTAPKGFMPLTGDLQSQAGKAHVGFIQDQPSAIAKPTAFDKPLRREDVIAPLVKAFNVPIYEGRIKGKGVLGLYRPKAEMVRIKHASDLEVTAHEMAHLLDDRIPEIQKAYLNNKEFRDELKSVSYDKTKIKEGFAEFVRLYMTQPELAAEKAPTFNGWFNDFLRRNEYGKAIKEAQQGMTAWFGQDALARAQSKIGTKTIFNDVLGGVWGKFRQSVSDDLHGLYRMERDLTGQINPTGAYESARLTRATHSIADGAIRHGYLAIKEDGSYTFKGKGLEQILEPVADRLDDFLLYAVGQSAKELKTQGREHLFTDAEIEAMRNLKQPGFEKAFGEYQQWNRGIVDFAQSRGVINPASRAMWQRQSYMPFHRIGQPGEARSMKPGEWSGIKALTGGTDNLKSILGNMISNSVMLIDKAVKNEALLKVADMADTHRGGGRFMVKIPTESRPVRIEPSQVLKEVLKSLGIEGNMSPESAAIAAHLKQQIENTPGFYEFLINNQSPAGSNVISVMRQGKHDYYEVADPLVLRSVQALDRKHQSVWVKWLGMPKRIGQMTVTMTPDFMVANIARDTLMGSIMSRHGFMPVIDSIKGMKMRMEKDQNYKDYIANGGGLSSQFVDEARFRHHMEKFYDRKGIDYRTVLDTPDKMLGFVEEIADAFEMSTRLGEYQRAIDKGEHPRHAAYMGREVSTDFAMKGDNQVIGFLYDTVMFLRPMVESIDRLGRGVSHDPNAKAIAVKTGMLAMTSMALYLHNRNNQSYVDMEDWKKDAYWHFYIPGTDGKDKHFMYPKVWEIGAVSSLAERTLEKTMSEDPQGLGKDVARILSTTFHVNLMPQVAAPLYEQAINRNRFTNSPIETAGMEELQPFLRAKHGTSETMKALGMATKGMPEELQFNPARGEALLRGYFNTWALYGLQMSDSVLYGDKLPEKRLDQYPVLRRFYEGEVPLHTKYESMFYDMLGEANRLHGTLRKLDNLGMKDIADQKEKEPLATKAAQLQRAATRLSTIEKDIEEIKRATLTPEEKRQHIDSLTVERNALLKASVLDVNPPKERP